MKKVFLGGTCNGSKWRKEIIPQLADVDIDWFDPVVDDWTEDCMAEEIKQRKTCGFVLYTITPKMTGVYSIAEVVDDSNKQPEKTILVILKEDENDWFNTGQLKSLQSVANMVIRNGGIAFSSLKAAVNYLETIK